MKNYATAVLAFQMFSLGFGLGDIIYNESRYLTPIIILVVGTSAFKLSLDLGQKKDSTDVKTKNYDTKK